MIPTLALKVDRARMIRHERLNATSLSSCDEAIPILLVTIDTEGDNLWQNKNQTITTQNERFLPRFQLLCDSYRIRPTYLVNYEMAISKQFQDFGSDILKRHVGEIGMHLHAWNTPPLTPLTKNDFLYQPYLTEYPLDVMQRKIAFMTHLLEDTFDVKIVSHRAGRWGFNEAYARFLVQYGYHVDCSVTPHVSWKTHIGAPNLSGGPDFANFPEMAYFVDVEDISQPGNSDLLEIPVTILPRPVEVPTVTHPIIEKIPQLLVAWDHFFSPRWLRPTGRNVGNLIRIGQCALLQRREYIEFMLHSSELMPGGSPNFGTDAEIEALYRELESFFAFARGKFRSMTLEEYYQHKLKGYPRTLRDA
jgi:hypothetical protein